jgi:shikimate kinase
VRPIFLIGFMGSGKTVVGRLLAAHLGRPHLDLDRMIEAKVGPLLRFLQRHGEVAFREEELGMLTRVLEMSDRVVSLGGGTPCQADSMDRLLASGTVVYIDAPLHELEERLLKKGRDRPLLFGLDDDELRLRVRQLLSERMPTYRRAHLIVDGSGPPEAIAARIAELLGQFR